MYFHNILIPRVAYFLVPLESKQEGTSGWNFKKCISEVKVNQLKVKNMYVKMCISTFKGNFLLIVVDLSYEQSLSYNLYLHIIVLIKVT